MPHRIPVLFGIRVFRPRTLERVEDGREGGDYNYTLD